MEKMWHRCIYNYLKCDPEEHVFILTEPPMNPPENREQIAEIMFETFNVKGLHIGVQAVLALYSNWENADPGSKQKQVGLTGTVCDSGDGVTHVIPVCDGYVIGSCIKHIPLAGRDITKFTMQFLKDRNEPIPPEDIIQVSREIKEKYSYCAKDLSKELQKFDEGSKTGKSKFKKYTGKSSVTGEPYSIDVGYEMFLGPEMFFKPEFIDPKYRTSIDEAIDNVIQSCPIDTRNRLYNNIVLSGGSTTIKNFRERLQKEVQGRVDSRLQQYQQISGAKSTISIDVEVTENPLLKYSVWHGGSMLAKSPGFAKMYHTRESYMENGPSIARHNPVFLSGM